MLIGEPIRAAWDPRERSAPVTKAGCARRNTVFGYMFFTTWVATLMVFIVMAVPIVFMAIAYFLNRKPLPPELRSAEAPVAARREARRR
jgi:hypothetical protein